MSPEIQAAMEHFSRIKTIPITNYNGFAIVDAEDYEHISQFKWNRSSSGKGVPRTGGSSLNISNLILQTNKIVDHINRNPLDNRKKNLRLASRSQNNCNTSLYKNNTSGIKGVHFRKDNSKWTAYIQKKGNFIYLGQFDTKEEAIKARNEVTIKYHGRFGTIG